MENATILGVGRMLSDPRYRAWVVKQIKDPAVRSFWQTEFAGYDKRFLSEAIAPVQNKVGQLVMSPVVRNILGQVRSRFDPRLVMDNRRIFIANLAKGRIGEDKSNLLGSMLVTAFQLAAMSRVDVPEQNRQDFFLFIDEFQNFATDSFVSILSEARKYRLCLTLAHQYIDQLDEKVRNAVFGNVGSLLSFRVGESDAEILAREYGSGYPASTFTSLGNYELCAKLLQAGTLQEPFLGKTLPPSATRYGRAENLIRQSRERYTTPREVVEDKIERWMNHG